MLSITKGHLSNVEYSIISRTSALLESDVPYILILTITPHTLHHFFLSYGASLGASLWSSFEWCRMLILKAFSWICSRSSLWRRPDSSCYMEKYTTWLNKRGTRNTCVYMYNMVNVTKAKLILSELEANWESGPTPAAFYICSTSLLQNKLLYYKG